MINKRGAHSHKNENNENDVSFLSLVKRCALFCLLCGVLYVLIALVASIILYNTNDPTSKIPIAGIASMYLSVLLSSFLMAKKNKSRYLLGGILLGTFVLLSSAMISLSIGENGNDGLIYKLLIPVFSLLGSIIGIKREKARKRRRKA